MLRRRFRDVHEVKEERTTTNLNALGIFLVEFPKTIETYFNDDNELCYIDDHGTPFATEYTRLFPNVRFEIDGTSYHTDAYGRVDYISANKARGFVIKGLSPEISPHVDMWNGMLDPNGKWTHVEIEYDGDDTKIVKVEITHEW